MPAARRVSKHCKIKQRTVDDIVYCSRHQRPIDCGPRIGLHAQASFIFAQTNHVCVAWSSKSCVALFFSCCTLCVWVNFNRWEGFRSIFVCVSNQALKNWNIFGLRLLSIYVDKLTKFVRFANLYLLIKFLFLRCSGSLPSSARILSGLREKTSYGN